MSRTIETARKKIAQMLDSADPDDLIYRHGVASGWLAALRLEGLLDEPTFRELSEELEEAHRARAARSP